MRELKAITIHPYSCDLPFIVKSIVALNSTLNDCTIGELLTAYSGSMKLFISWAAIPQNVAGLQSLQDSFVRIESPHQVKEFLNYLAQRKKACIIVELLSQDVSVDLLLPCNVNAEQMRQRNTIGRQVSTSSVGRTRCSQRTRRH